MYSFVPSFCSALCMREALSVVRSILFRGCVVFHSKTVTASGACCFWTVRGIQLWAILANASGSEHSCTISGGFKWHCLLGHASLREITECQPSQNVTVLRFYNIQGWASAEG